MARKRAALNNADRAGREAGGFFAGRTGEEPREGHAHEDRRGGVDGARSCKLSRIFNAYPEVLSSGVEFQVIDGITYLMNSEGTALRYDDSVAFMYAKAEGRRRTGCSCAMPRPFRLWISTNCPREAEMRKAFTAVAENVRALVKAPVGEAFSGPTLFEPQAAAQLLAQLLGDNLDIPRKPLAEPGRTVNFLPSELETKIGSRILPDWIDVTDDPTQTSWKGKPLVGYPFDLEGVPAKAVTVIEKGVLKSFPDDAPAGEEFPASNGHARLPGPTARARRPSRNLFVKASQATPLRRSEEEADRDVQGARQALRDAGAQAGFSVFGGRGELRQLAASSAQSADRCGR